MMIVPMLPDAEIGTGVTAFGALGLRVEQDAQPTGVILLGFTVSIYKGTLLKGETVIVFDIDSLSIRSTQPTCLHK